MSEDREVLKEVWEGKLPVCFRLSEEECGSAEPDEIYVIILSIEKIFDSFFQVEQFPNKVDDFQTNLFSSCNGQGSASFQRIREQLNQIQRNLARL